MSIERRSFVAAALAALASPLSLLRRSEPTPKFDASTKPIAEPSGPVLIAFRLTEDLTGSPWAKATVLSSVGYAQLPYDHGQEIHVWNPRVSMAAWAGYGVFTGAAGQRGVAVLSDAIRQPTHNDRERLPMIVAMDGGELEPAGLNWQFPLAAVAALTLWAASPAPAPAQGLFDAPAITLAQPITKLPAGGLFGSLLAKAPTAECECENCTCANCGCAVTTASEADVVANARRADQRRFVYTRYADGSFLAVPRTQAVATTTKTTTTYDPVVVRSGVACADGSCALPQASTRYSESRQSSYSSSYQAAPSYTYGRFTNWIGRARGSRWFGGNCANGRCAR